MTAIWKRCALILLILSGIPGCTAIRQPYSDPRLGAESRDSAEPARNTSNPSPQAGDSGEERRQLAATEEKAPHMTRLQGLKP